MTVTVLTGAIEIVLVTCSMQQVKFPLTYGSELIDVHQWGIGIDRVGEENKLAVALSIVIGCVVDAEIHPLYTCTKHCTV